MRNIFDQYTQPENRLTHSLVSALHHDRKLLQSFLETFYPASHPAAAKLQIIEQGLPGAAQLEEGEAIRRGLPDAVIFSDDGWILVIESKISAGLTRDQLRRHALTVQKCGFDRIFGLTITLDTPAFALPDWRMARWKDIYSWASAHKHSSAWAKLMVEYFEVAESKMAQDEYLTEGTITEFAGISFDPYTYLEGKRVLRLLTDKLRGNDKFLAVMGIDERACGRSSITRQDMLWDFLRLAQTDGRNVPFQCYPHCTLGIGPERAEAMITFPHGMSGPLRHRICGESFEDFAARIGEAAAALDQALQGLEGYRPTVRLMQRRYKTQRSVPYRDAVIEFDPRVTFGNESPQIGPPIKRQHEWARAVYELLKNKKSNLQFQLGVEFYHREFDELGRKDADKYFIAAFTALGPFVRSVIL